jgi:hypothetical protein
MDHRDLAVDQREASEEGAGKELQVMPMLSGNNVNHSCQEQLTLLYQPSCAEVQLSLRMATMLRTFQWDEKWMGLVPIRIGSNDSLDVAVGAYLEAQRLVQVDDVRANANNVRQYVKAIQGVQAMMNSTSFWTSDEAILTIGILSSYESTKGASLRYMFVIIVMTSEG